MTDPDVPEELRVLLLNTLFDAPLELKDELFTERLVNRFNEQKLDRRLLLDFGGPWNVFLRLWSWLVVCTVAHIEFTHGRNRAGSCRREHWVHFVAKVLNRESCRLLNQLADLLARSSKEKVAVDGKAPRKAVRTRLV